MGKKLKLFMALLVALLLLIGLLIGYVVWGTDLNDGNDVEATNNQQQTQANDQYDRHMHETYEVPSNLPKPEITDIILIKDIKTGWNLEIKTKNYKFTPENVNEEVIDNEGHAHLYIDGKKITRLYSPNLYISGYTEGVHEVKVTLNTNDHKDYTINGEVIQADTKIVGDHDHTNESDNHGH